MSDSLDRHRDPVARQFGQTAEKAALAGESLECYGYTFTAV